MAYVYILQNALNKKHYIGSCEDLQKRVLRHKNHTGGRTTKTGEWELLLFRVCSTIEEARKIEKQVKSYKSGNGLKKILSGEDIYWRGGRAG